MVDERKKAGLIAPGSEEDDHGAFDFPAETPPAPAGERSQLGEAQHGQAEGESAPESAPAGQGSNVPSAAGGNGGNASGASFSCEGHTESVIRELRGDDQGRGGGGRSGGASVPPWLTAIGVLAGLRVACEIAHDSVYRLDGGTVERSGFFGGD